MHRFMKDDARGACCRELITRQLPTQFCVAISTILDEVEMDRLWKIMSIENSFNRSDRASRFTTGMDSWSCKRIDERYRAFAANSFTLACKYCGPRVEVVYEDLVLCERVLLNRPLGRTFVEHVMTFRKESELMMGVRPKCVHPASDQKLSC